MHIFGILRLWGFQNTQFHLKVKETFCLMTLYRFFYNINSKFLLHKEFFSHHKHCSGWSFCTIKFIFQAKIRPKILAIFAQKWQKMVKSSRFEPRTRQKSIFLSPSFCKNMQFCCSDQLFISRSKSHFAAKNPLCTLMFQSFVRDLEAKNSRACKGSS